MTGRLLGVDFGTRRVGLAVCDPDRIIASPLATYERKSADADAQYFKTVAISEKVVGLVVGLPVHTSGEEGIKAKEARAYGAWLAEVTGVPVVFWDERFSTAQAESALWQAGLTHQKRKDRRDRVAAQMMLQSYLDAKCPADESIAPM
ncbi:MAG: Holliday junction resolvase RuvX [Gemmataceae bacterium]